MMCLLVIADLLYFSNFIPMWSFLPSSTACPKHGFLVSDLFSVKFLFLDKLNKAVYIVTSIACVLYTYYILLV